MVTGSGVARQVHVSNVVEVNSSSIWGGAPNPHGRCSSRNGTLPHHGAASKIAANPHKLDIGV